MLDKINQKPEVDKNAMRMLRCSEEKEEEIGKLVGFYRQNRRKIVARLEDFSKIPEKDYFYELCFCLCTPQSKARRCDIAVSMLKEKDFYSKSMNPSGILRENVRFHNHKTSYLVGLKGRFTAILSRVRQAKKDNSDPKELREFLVKEVKGLGYKEASHFLRNIGFRHLAILDRHILRNILRYGAVNHLPKTLTKKEYLRLEDEFENFSKRIGIDMDELDLLFWSMETGEIFK